MTPTYVLFTPVLQANYDTPFPWNMWTNKYRADIVVMSVPCSDLSEKNVYLHMGGPQRQICSLPCLRNDEWKDRQTADVSNV